MVAGSPFVGGNQAVGYNQAHIRYKYKVEKNFGMCEIYEPEVTISCDITLPVYNSRDAVLKHTMDMNSLAVKEHELTPLPDRHNSRQSMGKKAFGIWTCKMC